MSPQLPIPFPLVAVSTLLQLSCEPLISFPYSIMCRRSYLLLSKENIWPRASELFSFPPSLSSGAFLLSVFLHEECPSMAAHLCLRFPLLPSLCRIFGSLLSPASRRPLHKFASKNKSFRFGLPLKDLSATPFIIKFLIE